jgi:hypothetical protein
MKADRRELAGLCPSSNHSVRFPDGATLVAGSFQAFIGNFRPELFQLRRRRLAGVPFCIIRGPGHLRGSRLTIMLWKKTDLISTRFRAAVKRATEED